MAQTQLNRVYVQTIDSTGTTDPTLSLGVKSLTTTVKIGGIGTGGNSINVSSTGINMSGPLNALGQTNLQNTSILNVGITGQTTLQNTSINGTLNVAGLATLINVSTTSLSVLNNVSVGGNVSVTGNLYVSSNMILPTLTVGSNAVLANASVNGTLKVDGITTLKTLNADGLTTLNGLTVNQGANFNNSVGIANNPLTITGTGSFSVAGQTTLQNTSVQGLTASGKTWLSNTSITGPTDINVTGTATTTIGNSTAGTTVGGRLAVTGNCSLASTLAVVGNCSFNNVSMTGLTVGPLWAGATNVTSLVSTGNTSVQNVSAQALTVGPLWAGATTLASLNVTGPIRASGPCDFIVTTSTYSLPLIKDDNTISTTQFASVRYTPINSNSAYVSINIVQPNHVYRGISINTTNFPLLSGLTTIPVFTIPMINLRGNSLTLDAAYDNNQNTYFIANFNVTGGGWYNFQTSGSNTILKFFSTARPGTAGICSGYFSGGEFVQFCGAIGV